ncbi:SPRY domain-containing SOCS box protein 3-like isoform X1 [Patiria miniata]|uniref:SPRY domain-containing SOCS box protein 3 n=1 Tax=Patiria miniata TaxID=46514 RepID=A0A914ASL8_PATMI|nr:SPRY domain-containing SOCS box protein 3-like isoform X1 [Patiria miniata]
MTNHAKKGSRTREGSPRSSDLTDTDHPSRPKRARQQSGTGSASSSVSGSAALPPPRGAMSSSTATGDYGLSQEQTDSDMTEVRDSSECSLTALAKPQETHRRTGDISDSKDKMKDTATRGEIRMSPPECPALPHDPQFVAIVTVDDEHDDEGRKEETSCSSVDDGHVVRKWVSKQKSKNTTCKSCILRELDWLWNEEETSDACVHVLGNSGAQVFFHQDYSCGTAAARGTQPMSQGQHFWEIKMDSPVYGTAMMVGIGTRQIDLTQYSHTFCNMLGSDPNSESCGLSYTGRFYQGGGQGKAYCSKFGQGTVIGVHLDMWFGTLTYYKNGKCLGVATKGLLGKAWHPMISSTAARSSMCLQTARSFPSSLQFWCCRTLRRAVPTEHNVIEVLDFPPGMRAFLEDNLLWLLDSHSRGEVDVVTKSTQTDLSMATHQLSDVPLKKRPAPDTGEDDKSMPPS